MVYGAFALLITDWLILMKALKAITSYFCSFEKRKTYLF